ncbi:hypothetical protein BH18ACT6_BH18ACT6_21980 [soil metagenome]
MSPWSRGADVINRLLVQRELDRVAPSEDLGNRLLDEARSNLDSAITIREKDPGGTIQLAYDAARKAATGLLAVQGLRPTTTGGHVAVQVAANAQFDGPLGGFSRMRRRRHQQEYPSPESPTATQADAEEMINFATQVIELANQILETKQLTAWE